LKEPCLVISEAIYGSQVQDGIATLQTLSSFLQGERSSKACIYQLRQEGGANGGFYHYLDNKDQFLVSAGDEGAIVVYELATLKEIYGKESDYEKSIECIYQHAQPVTTVQQHAKDKRTFLSAGLDSQACIWYLGDEETELKGKLLEVPGQAKGGISKAAWLGEKHVLLAFGNGEAWIVAQDDKSGEPKRVFAADSAVRDFALVNDNEVIFALDSGEVVLLDIREEKQELIMVSVVDSLVRAAPKRAQGGALAELDSNCFRFQNSYFQAQRLQKQPVSSL